MRNERPNPLNVLSDAQVRLMLDQLPAYVWTTDADLRLTSFHGAGFAGQEEDIQRRLGLTLHEFFRTDDPLHAPIAAHRRALQGESAEYEISLYGREFQVRVEPRRDEQGTIVGCVGLGRDVTEQKRQEAALRASEARWRALFDSANVGVVIADLDRRIIACNPAYERLIGYREAELRGRRFPLATHPDDAGPDMALFRELVAGRRDHYQIEKRYVRKDRATV